MHRKSTVVPRADDRIVPEAPETGVGLRFSLIAQRALGGNRLTRPARLQGGASHLPSDAERRGAPPNPAAHRPTGPASLPAYPSSTSARLPHGRGRSRGYDNLSRGALEGRLAAASKLQTGHPYALPTRRNTGSHVQHRHLEERLAVDFPKPSRRASGKARPVSTDGDRARIERRTIRDGNPIRTALALVAGHDERAAGGATPLRRIAGQPARVREQGQPRLRPDRVDEECEVTCLDRQPLLGIAGQDSLTHAAGGHVQNKAGGVGWRPVRSRVSSGGTRPPGPEQRPPPGTSAPYACRRPDTRRPSRNRSAARDRPCGAHPPGDRIRRAR